MVTSARFRRKALPYLFVVPVSALLLLINFYPMLYSLLLSFSVWPIEQMARGPTLAGPINFERIVGDPRVGGSTSFMIFYVVVSIVLEFGIGMVVALLLDSRIRARGLVRTLVIVPIGTAPLVAALCWRYLLNSDYGMVNYLLSVAHVSPITWLSTLPWAQISVILVDVWHETPFVALILLAGLQAIPNDYVHAAHIDGASGPQVFWRITLPLLRPALLVAAVIRVTNAVRMFDTSFSLTGGGPFQSTETFTFLAYQEAFTSFDLPYAAAISWLIFLLNLVITLVIVRLLFVKVEV